MSRAPSTRAMFRSASWRRRNISASASCNALSHVTALSWRTVVWRTVVWRTVVWRTVVWVGLAVVLAACTKLQVTRVNPGQEPEVFRLVCPERLRQCERKAKELCDGEYELLKRIERPELKGPDMSHMAMSMQKEEEPGELFIRCGRTLPPLRLKRKAPAPAATAPPANPTVRPPLAPASPPASTPGPSTSPSPTEPAPTGLPSSIAPAPTTAPSSAAPPPVQPAPTQLPTPPAATLPTPAPPGAVPQGGAN